MKINEIMTRQVEVIAPNSNLVEAALRMRELNVGAIPVCNEERLLGMVTDRDIAIRGVAEGRDPRQTRVQEVMSHGIHYCFEDEDVKEAAKLMGEKQIRRLPILNRDKRMVGIVSLGDVSVNTSNEKMSGRALEEISKPSIPIR